MRIVFLVVLISDGFLSFSQTMMPGLKLSSFADLDKSYYQQSSGLEFGLDINWRFRKNDRHGFSFYASLGDFSFIHEEENFYSKKESFRGSILAAYNYYLLDKMNWYISLDLGVKYGNESSGVYFNGSNNAAKGTSSNYKSLSPHTGFECAYILGPVVIAAGLDGIYLLEFGSGAEGRVNLFPFVALRGVLN